MDVTKSLFPLCITFVFVNFASIKCGMLMKIFIGTEFFTLIRFFYKRSYQYSDVKFIRICDKSLFLEEEAATISVISPKIAEYNKHIRKILDKFSIRIPYLEIFLNNGKVIRIESATLINKPFIDASHLEYDDPIFHLVEIIMQRAENCERLTALTRREEKLSGVLCLACIFTMASFFPRWGIEYGHKYISYLMFALTIILIGYLWRRNNLRLRK